MRKIWPQTPTGTYLVKSGYKFLSQEGLLPDQQRAHTGQVQALWKQVWGLQVPNRVRNFICWACRNTIPTKTNVVWRQILNEDICEQWHSMQRMSYMHYGRAHLYRGHGIQTPAGDSEVPISFQALWRWCRKFWILVLL